MKNIVTALILNACAASVVNAALVDRDWQIAGDAGITYDSSTNLEWIDVTFTRNFTVNEMVSAFLPGGAFEGWRYAQAVELQDMSEAYGVEFQTSELLTSPEALAAAAAMSTQMRQPGDTGSLYGLYLEGSALWIRNLLIYGSGTVFEQLPWDWEFNDSQITGGNFIVRISPAVVPIPAAIWLFGSALGLLGWAQRKTA